MNHSGFKPLERTLAALVGGIIGGILTPSLAFTLPEWHWLRGSPIVVGMLAGALRGDRGSVALAKLVGWTA